MLNIYFNFIDDIFLLYYLFERDTNLLSHPFVRDTNLLKFDTTNELISFPFFVKGLLKSQNNKFYFYLYYFQHNVQMYHQILFLLHPSSNIFDY